jgi:hypothetical protein
MDTGWVFLGLDVWFFLRKMGGYGLVFFKVWMFGFFLGKWLDKDYLFGFGFLVFKGFSDLSVAFRLIDNKKIALIRKVYKSKTTLLLGFSIYFKKRDCPMQFFVILRYLFIW